MNSTYKNKEPLLKSFKTLEGNHSTEIIQEGKEFSLFGNILPQANILFQTIQSR